MLEAGFGVGVGCDFGCSLGAGDGVRGLDTGTRTLPSAGASSSSSRSERALEEGDTPLVEVVDTGRDEEGVDGEGEVRAAKSELAASEMRSEARFWLFVNLREWAGQ